MVDDSVIDDMYADEEQREKDEILRKKLGDKEFERQKYGIVEKGESGENADHHVDIYDLSAEEIVERAQEVIDEGGFVLFKFTCEYCGSRQTSTTPNAFHSAGYYCDDCGKLCRPEKYGMIAIFTKGFSVEQLSDIIKNMISSKSKSEK